MADNPEGTGPTNVRGATARFLEQLDDHDAQDAQEQEEATQDAPDEIEAQDEPDDGLLDVEDADVDEGEADDAPTEPTDETYTVKVQGEEVEVTLDELLNGYSRTSDYTRKAQELAEKRREFQETQQAVQQERQQYQMLLGQLQQRVQQTLPPEPDESLLDTNPQEYLRQEKKRNKAIQQLQAIQAEQQRAAQLQQQAQQQQMQAQLEQAQQQLLETIPEWKDEEVAKKEKADIAEFGMQHGFSPEEMAQVYDPRAVVVLRKAMKWDRAQRKASDAKANANKGPVAKPGSSGSVSNSRRKKEKQLNQRLQKTGDVRDAAAIFKERLERAG